MISRLAIPYDQTGHDFPKMQKFLFALYNAGWRLARPLLKLNPRLKDGYAERMLNPAPPGPVDIWIQAASAGEAYLTETLIKALPGIRPLDIRVSTNTRQGMEILEKAIPVIREKRPELNIQAAYFPFDQPSIMDAAVRQIDPKTMVLLETELWPGLLYALHKYDSQILIINARMTAKSLKRYLMIPDLWRALAPDRVLAISRVDAARFAELFGRDIVDVMPNIKFDRVQLDEASDKKSAELSHLLPANAPFLVLGSIRQEEEADIIKIIEELSRRFPDLVIGIFPRHMHRLTAWAQYLKKLQRPWVRRSSLGAEAAKPGTIILWDAFGELNAAYARATAVFVGGSLAPLGGQNFLEPLIHGVIPVIGPSWENFAWIGPSVFTRGLVHKTPHRQAAANALMRLVAHPEPRGKIRAMAADYIKTRQGGSEQAGRVIMQTLKNKNSRSH